MSQIQIRLLGTNGWYSTKTGNTLSILIQSRDQTIILDAGDGIHKIADLIPVVQTPAHLFLSHLHLDHLCGLHMLARCSFQKGLTIYGPPGASEVLARFIDYPFTVPIRELPYPVVIRDLSEGVSNLPFPVTTGYLIHNQPVFGYRIDIGQIITFCTDTGPCQNILNLGAGADLLISECSYLPGQVAEDWPHMNPETAIAYAQQAGAKKLLLVHFAADLYRTMDQRDQIASLDTAGLEVIIGKDDMEIVLPLGG